MSSKTNFNPDIYELPNSLGIEISFPEIATPELDVKKIVIMYIKHVPSGKSIGVETVLKKANEFEKSQQTHKHIVFDTESRLFVVFTKEMLTDLFKNVDPSEIEILGGLKKFKNYLLLSNFDF